MFNNQAWTVAEAGHTEQVIAPSWWMALGIFLERHQLSPRRVAVELLPSGVAVATDMEHGSRYVVHPGFITLNQTDPQMRAAG